MNDNEDTFGPILWMIVLFVAIVAGGIGWVLFR
jgi:hypothetical protein